MNKGLVYVFTGEGKGKTSAALGVAVRALLAGHKVCWVAFYKQESWDLTEKHLVEKFDNLEMHWMGKGFRIGKKTAPVGTKGHVVVDSASEEEHREAARQGLEMVRQKLETKPFLLVMDEILNAVSEGLLDEQVVLDLIGERGDTHLVFTGRGATTKMVAATDLVTECKKIKHPYDLGKLAVRGLDF